MVISFSVSTRTWHGCLKRGGWPLHWFLPWYVYPGVDYVPFTNTSNLVQAMKALWSSDEYSTSIINRSNSFVHQYCSKDSQMCYWKILLDEYYKLQTFRVDYPHKNAIAIDHSYFDTNITMLEFFFACFFVLWAFTCQCCLYISCKKERHVCCTCRNGLKGG